MKKILISIAAIMLLTGAANAVENNTFTATVEAGEEGVVVQQPMFFGNGGVYNTPIETGRIWKAPTTKLIGVNLKPYKITESFDDLITIDNNPVDFKFHLTFQNMKGKTPKLIKHFGNTPEWYINNLREPIRNLAREFTKSKKMFDMTTDAQTITKMQSELTMKISDVLSSKKIPIILINATVGKVVPPKEVITATIKTAVQKQRVKTQQERVKAEKAREEAEKAAAIADQAYPKQFNMTNTEYLKFKELENQRKAIENQNPVTIIMGGNVQPVIPIGGQNVK